MQQPAEYSLILAVPMIALIFLLKWAFCTVRRKRVVSLRVSFMGLAMEVVLTKGITWQHRRHRNQRVRLPGPGDRHYS